MSHKFTWRDLPSLLRYHNRQVFLDTSLAFTYAPGVLSSVLQSLATPGMCVSVHPTGIIGQVSHSLHKTSARLSFVAADSFTNPKMVDLLTHLSQQAGEMGAFRVLAEVEEGTPLVSHLLRAGFTPYAEQQVWRIKTGGPVDSNQGAWRPVSARDLGDIHSLYGRIVPSDVKRIEHPPTAADLQGVVFPHRGELAGYASTRFGPRGAVLDVWLDPSQDNYQAHIKSICAALPTPRSMNIYVRVRAYQQKLATAVSESAATNSDAFSQVVMVKHLAIHQKIRHPFKLPALEQQPDASTPIISSESNS